ncbi:MAG TPA: hypothetical protein VGH95_05695 [Candidatus Aquirickettsiella sp.]|jgi:hypothetical protein
MINDYNIHSAMYAHDSQFFQEISRIGHSIFWWRGIGVVTCIYYNPELNRYWAVDYRLYAPEQDGKGKLEHVEDMLKSAIYSKN